jgi:hypothetical protein
MSIEIKSPFAEVMALDITCNARNNGNFHT